MESIGAMFEGDHQWNNMNFNNEEADLMSQLMLGNCSLQNEFPITNMSNFGLFSSSTNYNSSEVTSSEMYSFSQGNSTYSCGATTNSSFFPFPLPYGPAGRYPPPMAYYSGMEGGDEFFNQDLSNDSVESSGQVAGGEYVLEGKTLHQQEMQVEDNETSKKRPRIPVDVKNKRIVKPKKNQEKLNSSEKNDNESSEDDSNGSNDELNGGSKEAKSALNLNGKTRASRGSATDPQSLYARKRRERINERLRILQTLVPNGTKVDISTMLEEAVQYVKFLQLQIKLLSSDDMWMYSPIAYNGMDIGLRLEN